MIIIVIIYYYYYYYYAAFNAPCVGHKDDESQAQTWHDPPCLNTLSTAALEAGTLNALSAGRYSLLSLSKYLM